MILSSFTARACTSAAFSSFRTARILLSSTWVFPIPSSVTIMPSPFTVFSPARISSFSISFLRPVWSHSVGTGTKVFKILLVHLFSSFACCFLFAGRLSNHWLLFTHQCSISLYTSILHCNDYPQYKTDNSICFLKTHFSTTQTRYHIFCFRMFCNRVLQSQFLAYIHLYIIYSQNNNRCFVQPHYSSSGSPMALNTGRDTFSG